MARAVGLDIGTHVIKIVEMTGSAKSPRISRLVVRQVPPPPKPDPDAESPPDPDLAISQVIREIFDDLKLPRDDVCASFDAGGTIFREITVPFREDEQIRKVVRFEAENHLHSHAIEDVVVNWVKTGESRDGSRLTIFATPKEPLARHLGILRAAGIEPASVDLDATAVFTACDAAGVFADSPNVVLLDVGAHSTNLVLVVEGKPLVLRSFLLGAENVSEEVEKELAVGDEEARKRALDSGMPRADDLMVAAGDLELEDDEGEKSLRQIENELVSDKRGEFVRKLHRETIRSLASLQEQASPSRVLLTGGGSLLPGLAESLQEKLDIEVERLDLSEKLPFKDEGQDPAYTAAATPTAVGCGLRMLGHDPLGVELLRDEFAPTNTFEVVKMALATCVTLLFLVLLGLAFVAKQRRDAERKKYNYATFKAESIARAAERQYLERVESETPDGATAEINTWLRRLPRDERRADLLRAHLLRRYRELESALGLARDIPPVPSSLKVWLEVVRALSEVPRDEYGYLRILKMDISPRRATVRIEVEDESVFDIILRQFEQSDYFRERSQSGRVVSPGPQQLRGEYWQRDFDFRFREEG